MQNESSLPGAPTRKWMTISFFVAALGLGLGLMGVITGVMHHDNRPLLGWLMGTAYWLAPMIGLLMLTMLLYVFDAGWSAIVRRQMEHLLSAFKWIALMMVPLLALAWIGDNGAMLWKWLDPMKKLITGHGTVGTDPLYLHKSGYLNKEFFTIRSVIFIALWIALAEFFRRQSFGMDRDADPARYGRCRRWAAGGIVLMALTLTFASIDWFKSLDYHWFSTMYGVWFFAASMFSGIALTIITLKLAEKNGTGINTIKGLISHSQYYLIGCLMLAFTVFWAYISFSQYLIVYAANIPEETFWYVVREVTGSGVWSSWGWVSIVLLLGHFLFPFLLLIFFNNKVNSGRLMAIALWCLLVHAVDIYWNILPGFIKLADGTVGHRPFGVSMWEVFTMIGGAGLVAGCYLQSAAKRAALPKHDPRVKEALHYHI